MKWIAVVVALLGLGSSVLAWPGAASATSSTGRLYLETSKGVVVSTTPNQIMGSGIVRGTPIVAGTTTSESAGAGAPPPCSSGTAPGSGSSTEAAKSGNLLFVSYAGSVCESASTAVSATYAFTGTFTIDGGTGRFAGATGGGTLVATFTLYATPQGSQGPSVTHSRGRIFLVKG